MEKLKQCPFCGGKPHLESSHRAFIDGKTTRVAFVRCVRCNARSGRVKLSDFDCASSSSDANAIVTEMWNRRVGET